MDNEACTLSGNVKSLIKILSTFTPQSAAVLEIINSIDSATSSRFQQHLVIFYPNHISQCCLSSFNNGLMDVINIKYGFHGINYIIIDN